MSELFSLMVDVLGHAFAVWFLFIMLMILGGCIGCIAGKFAKMSLGSLAMSLLAIGVVALVMGARFSDTGKAIPIGLIVAALMLASFIISAAFAPHRYVEVPANDHAVPHWDPASGRFQSADHYDLRHDCSNPVGSNLDIRA